jgi:hypothetical protein
MCRSSLVSRIQGSRPIRRGVLESKGGQFAENFGAPCPVWGRRNSSANFGLRTLALSIACALATFACGTPAPLPEYPFTLAVYGAHDVPLAQASLSLAGSVLGSSDTSGVIRFELRGAEGETKHLELLCPEGHSAPERTLEVTLRRLADTSVRPEYSARCSPLEQSSVIVVRADNGVNLPILHLGRVVAHTDASGAAHFVLSSPAQEAVELAFDTSDSPRLRPQNPSARFAVRENDDLIVVNQSFSFLAPQRVARHRPYRIGTRPR